jgi:hypothetical protein
MPIDVFSELKKRPFYMDLITEEKIYLLIFNPLDKNISQWLK